MIKVNEIYDLVSYTVNKDQQGNNLSASEYNTILKAVNIGFFKQRYGLPEEYQAGAPLPKMSYEITQKIIDDLRAFKVRMGIDTAALILDRQGRANIPSDYVHFSSAGYKQIKDNVCGSVDFKMRNIEHLSDAQVNERLGNSLKKPTLKNPCFTTYSTYFQFFPANLRNIDFTYLRMPVTPVYRVIFDNQTDREIYDPSTSVHFEYPEDCFEDIARLVCAYVGINLRAVDVIQFNEMKKQQGV